MASSRHLWVGGLPEEMDEAAIKDYFSKYGKIEGVKILPQRYPNIGLAAFIDFFDVKGAIEAKEAKHKIGNTELRTNFKTKAGDKFDRREGGKWRDSQGEGEKHESAKSEKSRGRDSSSSSSDSASSSSSSSSESESEEEGEGSRKKGGKRGSGSGGPLFIKVTSLASRSERILQDGLYYEFSRHSPSVIVRMYGEQPDKSYAIVKFRKSDECKAAYKEAQGILLFGSKIKLTLLDKDDFPPGGRDPPRFPHGPGGGPMGPGPHPFPQEELDPQATRSLFVGNIPKNISVYELRDIFQRFGNVLDVEIKKMSGNATYGFVLFYDLMDAVAAKQCMDGELIRGNKIRVGFGKGTASKTLWVDGMDPTMNEGQLERHMTKYGKVMRLGIDRHRHCAMVQFDTIENAKDAINAVKGTFIGSSKRIMADFANRDAKAAFFSRLESGEHPGPPRGFPSGPGGMYNPGMNPRGGMMMPRGGMPMMGMGRGGFPPHGPPMDYFYPYMEEGMGYYGGGRPPFHAGPGMMGVRRFSHGHAPYEEGFDDYEDELRAFSRKREWEKEREKRKERKKRRSTSSEGEESDSEDSSSRRKKKSKEKDKKKSGKKEKDKKSKEEKTPEKSEGETDSGEEQRREEVRLRATQRSRDLREKLKKKGRGKRAGKEAKSDGEASSEGEESSSEKDSEVKKPSRKERGRDKERSKDRGDREKSRSSRKKDEERASSRRKHPKTAETPPPERHSRKKKREKPAEKEAKESGSETEKTNGKAPETPPPRVANGGEEEEEGERGTVQSPKLEEPRLPPEEKEEEEIAGDEPSEEVIDDGKVAEPEATPPSPSPRSPSPLGKRSNAAEEGVSKPKLESDLSSGEDFRDEEEEAEVMEVREATPPPREREKSVEQEPREEVRKVEPRSRRKPDKQQRSRSPRPKSPDSGSEGGKRSSSPPPGKKPPPQRAIEEEADEKLASDSESRRSRKLPRQYKLEEEERRERQREVKDHRHPKRPSLLPTTPSPPPAFASQGHRRRRHFSPPHPEYFERRWHRRGRYHSPGPYGHRRHSRSPPPGYPPSPPHRPRSPYSGSPPRSRTPIQRPGRDRGGPRYRFDSPPYDVPRGKYQRRGSPPSPPHRRYSPSPPPRPHSPVRRHGRHRSHTPSPPRRSPVHRRERSHSTESGRSSPRYPEDRYDSRRHGKRPPRSPSPKGKHREAAKEDYPEPKRRRVEESRPKSPSGTPPPPQEDTKPSRTEKSHPAPQPSSSGGYSSEAPPPGSQRYRGSHSGGEGEYGRQQQTTQSQTPGQQASYRQGASELSRGSQPASGGVARGHAHQAAPPNPQQADNLLDLLRRYPVMWQGHLMLKNESAAVQLHFLSGNVNLAKLSLPQPSEQHTPCLRIAQRMRLEQTQLEGVYRRIQNESEHCLLLALPCGRDANDVRAQTHALKNSLISYLLQKQAAGIINVQGPQTGFVLHIFPPCPFSQGHLSRVAPDLLSSASDNCHLMIVVATM